MEYFSNPDRQLSLSPQESNKETLESDKEYACTTLFNIYRFHRRKDISRLLRIYNYDLVKTSDRLDRLPRAFKNPREMISMENKTTKNISLLQEVRKCSFFLRKLLKILYLLVGLFISQKRDKRFFKMERRELQKGSYGSRSSWTVTNLQMLF